MNFLRLLLGKNKEKESNLSDPKVVVDKILNENLKLLNPILDLTYLELTKSKPFALTEIPMELYNFSHLKELHLGLADSYYMSGMTNTIQEVHKEINKLKDLELLSLGENNLTSLPEEIGELKNLKKLYLQNNNLESLPESFGMLENLETLALFNNPLTDFPKSMTNLKNLKNLTIFGNGFTELPEFIYSLDQLEVLCVLGPDYDEEIMVKNRTKLSRLSSRLLDLKNLKEVNFGGHGLSVDFEFPKHINVVQ
jgi:Leucine-rich repeat (LRR) protein